MVESSGAVHEALGTARKIPFYKWLMAFPVGWHENDLLNL